ncbi:S-layer homology domain-containing protein [Paenibacillus sp. FSL R5-0490]|uniref:S-layer homology domain-containing protein n=1 Tax=Paenibacillus sp. FSL R5-0490 TaxID=1920424 RepID=UPI0030D10B10
MFYRKVIQKVSTFILATSLVSVLSGVAYGQKTNLDIEGHWAEYTLSKWLSEGLIKGYSDQTLKPNDVITRGEFMALVNRQFDFNEVEELHFTDLSSSNWSYLEVQKAVKAGYIQGYKDQTIRTSKPISRQEAAVIVADLLKLPSNEKAALAFKDSSEFTYWSKGAIGATFSKYIITGYTNGSFKPASPITRAEAVVMLDKAISLIQEQEQEQEQETESEDKDNIPSPSIPTASLNSDSNTTSNGSGSPSITTGVKTSTLIATEGVKAVQGISQVATLTITSGADTAGSLRATFTDGVNPVTVYVELDGTELDTEVAAKIVQAFDNALTGWNVDAERANIYFTALNPAVNNDHVKATVESIMTGVVSSGSVITVPGSIYNNVGTAQVATLVVENGATAPGSYNVYFTDGGVPVQKNIYMLGTETAAEVASKIAVAFGTSVAGWVADADGTRVHFTSQTAGTNNENVRIYALEASGVGAPSSTLEVPGNPATNTSQVIKLHLPNSESDHGPIGVKFTDGVSSWTAYVSMMGSPETGSDLADKIVAAFGNTIPNWIVSSRGSEVIFTAEFPVENNIKAMARLSGLNTGIGMPDSSITSVGTEPLQGTAQVATLVVENGATAPGSYNVYFTDGGVPVQKNIYMLGTETAAEVASKIAVAFGTSVAGWVADADGTRVHFTSQTAGTNNENVRIYALEASGVGAPSSTLEVPGNPATNTSQVIKLRLPNSESDHGPIGVKFTDGVSSWTAYVSMMGSPETGSDLADKIVAAFGNTIPNWIVSSRGSDVIFTAEFPAENNIKAMARLSGLNTGIGMPDSTITTVGAPYPTGEAQVATLVIDSGATAAGTITATFTDGSTTILKDIELIGTETAAEVATKIAWAFNTSLVDWNATSNDRNVIFTARAPSDNNPKLSVAIVEATTGIGFLSSSITTQGSEIFAGVKQVVSLKIDSGPSAPGIIRVVFRDGTNEVSKRLRLSGTETLNGLAEKIGSAFENSMAGWNVTTMDQNVIFTASTPEDNNSNVSIVVYQE